MPHKKTNQKDNDGKQMQKRAGGGKSVARSQESAEYRELLKRVEARKDANEIKRIAKMIDGGP